MIAIVATFAVAFVGVAAFFALGLPLPWLLGPLAACLVAALVGVPMKGIKPLNDAMRTVRGGAVGATLTPAVIATFPAMWPTLLLIPVMVAAIGAIGIPYFIRVWKYDFPTAYYSTMPGGRQDMLVFGEEAGGKVRTLSLIHATRVLVIVVALPFILQGLWEADLSHPPGVPAALKHGNQKHLDDALDRASAHQIRGEAEDVRVVVPAGHLGAQLVVGQCGADASDFVGRNARTDPRPADQDAPFEVARGHRAGHGKRGGGVVHGLAVLAAEDFQGVACGFQGSDQSDQDRMAAVVSTQGDVHGATPSA